MIKKKSNYHRLCQIINSNQEMEIYNKHLNKINPFLKNKNKYKMMSTFKKVIILIPRQYKIKMIPLNIKLIQTNKIINFKITRII